MKIKDFQLSRTPIASDYEFHHNMIDLVLQCAFVLSVTEKWFTPYKAAFDELARLLEIPLKSELTEQIELLDGQRDGLHAAIRSAVISYKKSLVPEKQAAAKSLDVVLTSLRLNTQAQYVEQTGQLDNLLAVLLGAQRANVVLLGLLPLVEEMQTVNNRLHELVDDREHVFADRYNGSSQAARKQADEAYRAYREFVNAFWLVCSETLEAEQLAALEAFINDVNTVVGLFDRVVLKDSASDKEDADKPTPPPTDPDTPPTDETGPDTDPEPDTDPDNGGNNDNNQGGGTGSLTPDENPPSGGNTGGGNTNPGGGYVPPSNGGGFD